MVVGSQKLLLTWMVTYPGIFGEKLYNGFHRRIFTAPVSLGGKDAVRTASEWKSESA